MISLFRRFGTSNSPSNEAAKQTKNAAFVGTITGHSSVRSRLRKARTVTAAAILGVATGAAIVGSQRASASTMLIGAGSSAAGPLMLRWTADTANTPYSLQVDYTATSSGDGRFNFGNNTVDFAVSDIPYQGIAFDAERPSFPFVYVPISAEGVAFMYHLDGLPAGTTLHLSSRSICALMTGGVTTWNDPVIAADNPGVTLPATPVHPVIRSDLAGTNFVLQEYCIHEQPALWSDFVTSPIVVDNPAQVGDLDAIDLHRTGRCFPPVSRRRVPPRPRMMSAYRTTTGTSPPSSPSMRRSAVSRWRR